MHHLLAAHGTSTDGDLLVVNEFVERDEVAGADDFANLGKQSVLQKVNNLYNIRALVSEWVSHNVTVPFPPCSIILENSNKYIFNSFYKIEIAANDKCIPSRMRTKV